MADVVTFGEAMLRLTPPGRQRVEQCQTLNAAAAGGEYNVAVALARLGVSASFVTRLPRNPIGALIADRCREHGVDTSNIIWADDERAGVYFIEPGAQPRGADVLYDRRDSAMSRIEPGEIDWPRLFGDVKVFHLTGVTPALSQSAAEACEEALLEAREAGLTVCVDLNYRAKLWTPQQACSVLSPMLEHADVFIGGRHEVELIFSIHHDDEIETMRELAGRFMLSTVLFTRRKPVSPRVERFSARCLTEGALLESPAYEIEIVDRIGGGDAFTAAWLAGYLREDASLGLRWGAAGAALQATFPGDLNWIRLDEIERLLEAGERLRIER